MLSAVDIKNVLENAFDLPFNVRMDYLQQEPHFWVVPSESHEHLFALNVSFINKIRMEMQFEPQKYAAEMVREMGNAKASKKTLFCSYASQLANEGAKFDFRINDIPQSFASWNDWPDHWKKIHLKVDIRPIEIDKMDQPDYLATIHRWLPALTGLPLSLLRVEMIESDMTSEGKAEGKKYDVITSKYERNPVNRVLCLAKNGYSCKICGFDFEKTYGDIGKEFIHVHHIIPVSQMGDDYIVRPDKDLIPVCPNCHAMLHKTNPPIDPAKLMEIIKEQADK